MGNIAARGQYRPHAHARGLTLASISFVTNNTDDPDGIIDPGGVVDSITHDDTGTFTINFNRRYAAIHAAPHISGTDGKKVTESAKVTGAEAANSLELTVYDAAASTADDSNNLIVTVFFSLYDHTDSD